MIMITQLLPKPTSRYSDRQPNPDKPELNIQSFEDRENSPIKFLPQNAQSAQGGLRY
jgi:hypothetical protein